VRWGPLASSGDIVEDLGRQAVLERLGWRFIRIRGSEFYRDPDGTVRRVFVQLERMGVHPESYLYERELKEPQSAQSTKLSGKPKRSAWAGGKSARRYCSPGFLLVRGVQRLIHVHSLTAAFNGHMENCVHPRFGG